MPVDIMIGFLVLAILFIDLDNFKYVNDSMGHSIGDKLLKIIGNKLIESTRKSDTVSRWGGDEFTILLPNIKRLSGIYKLCDRILNTHLKHYYHLFSQKFVLFSHPAKRYILV